MTDEERGGRLRALTREMVASYRELGGLNRLGKENLPAPDAIVQLLEELLALVFPGYHGAPVPQGADLELQMGGRLDNVSRQLAGVLADILRFCHRQGSRCEDLWAPAAGDLPGPAPGDDRYAAAARRLTLAYLAGLPAIRRLTDSGCARRLRRRSGRHELGRDHPLLSGRLRRHGAPPGPPAAGTGRSACCRA